MASVANVTRSQRRGRPREAEAASKRQGIIDAATALFLTSGYRAVSMREVAQLADVSTRTLYNLYADKTSLFVACLESLSPDTPGPTLVERGSISDVLRIFAINMLRTLSKQESLAFARLVMIDGRDVPELAKAGFANQERQFVEPLAGYFRAEGFEQAKCHALASLFIAMAITEWNQSVTFHLPMPDDNAIIVHAEDITRIFLDGARQR
jgi:AcrR family transcriptional regulator